VTLLTSSFARHETFHPRVGWLSKAVHAVSVDGEAFQRESAPVDLGVGKNMVRAIRYWALATKVIEEQAGARSGLRPSMLGRYLLGEHGVDPYAEDSATLWLLHWSLLQEPAIAPTWWWAFNSCELVDFDQDRLLRAEGEWVSSLGWARPPSTSLERDVDCLVRMYARRPGLADPIDSPFASLGLMEPVPGMARHWRFSQGAKETLDPSVVLFVSLMQMLKSTPGAQTITVARLATGRGGPGRAFRLSDGAIAAALRTAAQQVRGVSVVSVAGLTQLAVHGDIVETAADTLHLCYGEIPEPATLGFSAALLIDRIARSPEEG
jgi:hypothetical protein